MANTSPAIVFSFNSPQLATETIGPAYAAHQVGHMNVNSGQTIPTTLGQASQGVFGNATTNIQTQARQFFLMAGIGLSNGTLGTNNGRAKTIAGCGINNKNMNYYTTNGQFTGPGANLEYNTANNTFQQTESENAAYNAPTNGYYVLVNGVETLVTSGSGTFTAFGTGAIYLRNMYCNPDPRDNITVDVYGHQVGQKYGGNAPTDRDWLSVVTYDGV